MTTSKIEKKDMIYEGKAKKLYLTEDKGLLIQYFKDDATAFNAQKRGEIAYKGIINNKISERVFQLLSKNGIPSHFVKRLDDRQMLVKRLKIIPVEVVVRNLIAGSLAKRLGIEEGRKVDKPILEFYLKNDALGDPMVNEDHIRALGLATGSQIATIKRYSLKINRILKRFFEERNLILVDFKLEFGIYKNRVILGDEFSPDTCRLWDVRTLDKLDKDRFRRDLGRVEEAYQEVLERVMRA